jgi:hypothetical protein
MLEVKKHESAATLAEKAVNAEARSAPPDKVTHWLSIISLSVAGLSFILSFISLYFSALRPAKLQISVGTQVLVNYYRKIGVLCTFTNDGANQIVITSASLKWQAPAIEFKLGEVSPTLDKWEYVKENGVRTKKIANHTSYTVFSPLAVKQKDQATAILWFSAPAGFRFAQGHQTFTVEALSNSGKVAETEIIIDLSEEAIKSIDDNKDDEISIDVVGQKQK